MRIGAGEKGGAENRCQQVLQPVKAVAGEVVPQPLYGEIGIDNAHKGADEEEQQQDFDAIIHKKFIAPPKAVVLPNTIRA